MTELIDSQGNPIIISEAKSDRVLDPADTEETMLHEGKKKKGVYQKLFGTSSSKKTEQEDRPGLVEEDDPDFHTASEGFYSE